MTSSKSSADKATTGFRQSPVLEFFLQEDTSKNDDPRGRKRATPMKVLCLGLPRSGTESLAKALEILDMKAYHDKPRFHAVENANHARLWHEAICAKHFNRGTAWGREEFDQLLGDCSATTDVPCAFFALEMIQAYPEAKVILNKREFSAWHKSVVENLGQILKSWFFAVFMRMDPGLLSIYRLYFNLYYIMFSGDMQRNGRMVYDHHYALVRGAMVGREKDFMEWEVADGWGPLCDFLGVKVPDVDFPRGNASAEFDLKIQRSTVKRFRRALRNILVLIVLTIWALLWVGTKLRSTA